MPLAAADAGHRLGEPVQHEGRAGQRASAVIFALRSTYEPQAKIPTDGALQAHEAARGDTSNDAESDAHLVEEADWQMKALDLISKTPPPYSKTWFKEIDVEPKWLADYQEEWGT